MLQGTRGAIFEAKVTHCADAVEQLADVYLPLCRHIWPRVSWTMIEVVRNWAPETGDFRFIEVPKEMFSGGYTVWHWRD